MNAQDQLRSDNGLYRDGYGPDPYGYGEGRFDFDIRAIWAAIYRSRVLIITVIAVCFVLGVALTLLMTPIYRATATVQIDQEAAKVLGTEETLPSAAFQDADRFLQTQLDVIRSRAIASAVADSLRLNTAAFLETMGVKEDEFPGLTPEQSRKEQVIEALSENLAVTLPRDSRVVRISFESRDAALSARIANSFAENFIRKNLERKFDTSSYAREFLADQLKKAQARLEDSQREALAYSRSKQIIDTSRPANEDDKAGPTSITTARLIKLNADYSEALSRRLAAQQKWQQAGRENVLNLPEVLGNQAVQNLLQQRALLRAEYQDQLERRKEDFPAVRQAQARLTEVEQQLNRIASNIRGSLKNNYEVAVAQENAMKAALDAVKSSTLAEQSDAIQLSILQRDADTNRSLYDALLTRYNELNAQAGVQSNNLSIIDRAAIPVEPVSPRLALNLLLSLVAGVGLAGGLVFLRERLLHKVRTPDDVERALHVPMLGSVPSVGNDSEILAELQNPKSPIVEAYNGIRTALTLSSRAGLPKTVALTSALPSEGKSVSAYALALALARTNKNTLVIDLDLRRPTLHRTLAIKNSAGMSNILTGDVSIEDVVRETQIPGLSAITSGLHPPNPAELLSGERLAQTLEALSARYDCVIVDSPPVLELSDVLLIGAVVDSVVFVTESGRNSSAGLTAALKRLRQSQANIVGAVLTKFDPDKSGYGDYYHYAYSYGKS